MRSKIIEGYFSCPHCSAEMSLTENQKSIFCAGARRHLWDISASGYVNLAASSGGDPADCVKARRRFLALGHYSPLAEKISELIERHSDREALVDAGCGEGYYTARFAESVGLACGFDLSRAAIEAAAKRRLENAFFAVAGINAMPLASERISVLTNIFAPCFEAEFARVLKPGGALIIAAAGERHLLSLKDALYDTSTLNTERADLPTSLFDEVEACRLSYDFELTEHGQIADLFAMTPYYYRTGRESFERLDGLDRLTVGADFTVKVYIKR